VPRRARQEEVEPRIALDITQTFTRAGAVVLPARTLGDAHQLVEQNSLSAAVFEAGTEMPTHYGRSSSRKISRSASTAATRTRFAIAGLLSQKEFPHAESPAG
jgi:hypothetical protein